MYLQVVMSVFQCVLHSDQCLNLFDRLELAADKEFRLQKRMSSSVKHVYQSMNTASWSDLFSCNAYSFEKFVAWSLLTSQWCFCSSVRFAAEASFTFWWCSCSFEKFITWSSFTFWWCFCSSERFIAWSSLTFWWCSYSSAKFAAEASFTFWWCSCSSERFVAWSSLAYQALFSFHCDSCSWNWCSVFMKSMNSCWLEYFL